MSGNNKQRLRCNERDMTVAKTIDRVGGYMTTPQIHALFFQNEKACQRRLRQLTHAGVLRRIAQPFLRGEGSKPYLYAIGPLGAQLLAKEQGIAPYQVDYRPKHAEAHYFFLEHILAITDVRIAVTLACKKHGIVLESWQTDREIKRQDNLDYVVLTSPNGREEKVAVIPDSYFILRRENNSAEKTGHFFLEVDRSTVTVQTTAERRSWRRKVQAFLTYFESDAFRQRYNGKIVHVLTVTTGWQRMRNLIECTQEAGGSKRFWFTTLDYITAEDVQTKKRMYHDYLLTAPIWQRVGLEGTHALLAGS